MPETPTPPVNGQVLSGPELQASMSMLSLAPAASTDGSVGSIAIAGSFCLFCENGVGGLPALTRTSCAAAGEAPAARAATQSKPPTEKRRLRTNTSRVREAGPPGQRPPGAEGQGQV